MACFPEQASKGEDPSFRPPMFVRGDVETQHQPCPPPLQGGGRPGQANVAKRTGVSTTVTSRAIPEVSPVTMSENHTTPRGREARPYAVRRQVSGIRNAGRPHPRERETRIM